MGGLKAAPGEPAGKFVENRGDGYGVAVPPEQQFDGLAAVMRTNFKELAGHGLLQTDLVLGGTVISAGVVAKRTGRHP